MKSKQIIGFSIVLFSLLGILVGSFLLQTYADPEYRPSTWLNLSNSQEPDQDKSSSSSEITESEQSSSVLENNDPQDLPPVNEDFKVSDPDFQTVVENFQFFYSLQDKILSYDGTVTGSSGCAFVSSKEIFKKDDFYILEIETSSTDQENPDAVCTQIIVQLPVQGIKEIEFSQQELENFDNLFKINSR